jgi:hypothetical protein
VLQLPERAGGSVEILRLAQDDNRQKSRRLLALEYRSGQQGGKNEKALRAKVLGGSQKIFWETRKAL